MTDAGGGLRRRLPIWMALIWLAALTIGYVLFHYPVIGRAVLGIVAVAVLVTLGGGLGRLIAGDLIGLDLQARPAIQSLLGLGLLALIILAVGMAGLLPPAWLDCCLRHGRTVASGMAGLLPPGWLGWVITIALLLVLGRWAQEWARGLSEALRLTFEPLDDPFLRWLRAGALILLAVAFILALAPPTKWDALTYHLAGPQAYLTARQITAIPENHFLGFPQIVEMLYLWLMLLARPQAAAILHWCIGVFVLFLLLALARRAGKPLAGWVAVIALLVGESLWAEFSYPYNDLGLLAFIVAALMLIMTWEGEPQREGLVPLAGVMTGLAMGVKYTAAGAAIGIGILGLWMARRSGFARMTRVMALLILPALVVFSAWLVKNSLLLGNPVAPLIFETRGFDALDQWYYLRPGTGLNVGRILLAPVEATVFGLEGGAPYQAASGALVAGLIPLAAVGWRQKQLAEREIIKVLALFSLPGYLIWALGLGTSWYLVQTRLLFPIFPAAALIGGLGLEGLRDLDVTPIMSRIGRILVLVALVFSIIGGTLIFIMTDPLPVISGIESEDDYLARTLGAYALAMREVNNLPPDSRILFLWEPRVFYCQRDCIPDSMINQWWHDRQIDTDPARIAEGWRERGVTHVLIFETGLQFLLDEEPYEPLTGADVAALDALRRDEMIEMWGGAASAGHYTLYLLRSEEP